LVQVSYLVAVFEVVLFELATPHLNCKKKKTFLVNEYILLKYFKIIPDQASVRLPISKRTGCNGMIKIGRTGINGHNDICHSFWVIFSIKS